MAPRAVHAAVPSHFCAACGAPLDARRACTRCGRTAYVNSKPCAGAILARGTDVLLSRRAREPHLGAWDLPGGFLDAGEHPEEGVLREILEETGLRARIRGLVHVGIGAYGEDFTLNLVYALEADGEPIASDDSAELRWFPLDRLPPLAFPHEAEALARYREGRWVGRESRESSTRFSL